MHVASCACPCCHWEFGDPYLLHCLGPHSPWSGQKISYHPLSVRRSASYHGDVGRQLFRQFAQGSYLLPRLPFIDPLSSPLIARPSPTVYSVRSTSCTLSTRRLGRPPRGQHTAPASWRPWLTMTVLPHSPPARTAPRTPLRYGGATRRAPFSATPAASSSNSTVGPAPYRSRPT